MPEKPKPDAPEKVKRFLGWLRSVDAGDVLQEAKEIIQDDPYQYAIKQLDQLFKGKGLQAEVLKSTAGLEADDISQAIASFMQTIYGNKAVVETAESIGAVLTEPVLSILETYAGKEDFDPMEFARAFHGVNVLLKMPKAIGKMTDITIAGTKLSTIGDAMEEMYWALGLGFLGWQTLAPLLSAGLQPRLERHYNKLYHPKRLSLSDMVFLYLTDSITLSKLTTFIEEEGYQPELTSKIVENSFRSLNRSELEELYALGKLNRDGIYRQYIKQGYMPVHAQYFTDILTSKAVTNDKGSSVTQLRQAYKKGLRTRNEFRDALEALEYSKDAITLELELLDYDIKYESRDLSIGQIKSAYIQGVLTKTEVLNELFKYGYTSSEVETIIQTWDAEKKPKILKLNQSSVIAAYNAGVLNQSQALARLIEIGYPSSEASIIVQTANRANSKTGYKISLAMLMQAKSINALSQSEFTTRLQVEGLDSDDIKIINAMVNYSPLPKLSQEDIERAFKAGVIPDTTVKSLLIAQGLTGTNLDIKLKTWIAESEKKAPKLSLGTLLLYYRQGIVSSVQLRSKLREYDYSDNDIDLFIKSANLALPDDLTRTEIHDLYLAGVIDKTRVGVLVQKTGLDTQETADFIKGLDVELDNNRPEPGIGDYLSAVRNGILNESELRIKLRELGYDTTAVNFYVKLSQQAEKESTATLSKSDILNAYGKGLWDRYTALEALMDKGYSEKNAQLLIDLKDASTKPAPKPKP